jgi:cell division cycle protein 20 (cofactor of APC complex)
VFQRETSPSIHATPLFATAVPKSAARKSAKSNIASASSPKRLELGLSEWTLTGTGTPSKQRATRPRPQKTSVRIAYNAADRFIPNRTASEAICNVGTGKLDLDRRPKSSSTKTQDGSSVLANAATASAFEIGGRGSEDDLTHSIDSLDLNDDEDGKSSYAKPAPDAVAYESSIASACGVSLNTRILAFKPAPPESSKPIDLRSQYNRPLKAANAVSAQHRRRILTSPERVLDAPNIVDDYYLNLLDWSCNNQVAIGLGQSVYVWSAETGGVSSLLETTPDTYISSLKWSGDGAYVSVGLGTGEVQIWDVEEGTKLRSMFGHDSRVSVMGKSVS